MRRHRGHDDAALPRERVAQDRCEAQIRHALCDARLCEELQSAVEGSGEFQALHFNSGDLESRMREKPDSFDNVQTSAQDVAVIAFTSGTTGKPKAAMHFHRDIMATCDTYGKYVLQARESDLFAGSPPLGFTFGLGGLLLFPLYAGAATLLLEKAQPEPLMQAIQAHGVNVVFTAPSRTAQCRRCFPFTTSRRFARAYPPARRSR